MRVRTGPDVSLGLASTRRFHGIRKTGRIFHDPSGDPTGLRKSVADNMEDRMRNPLTPLLATTVVAIFTLSAPAALARYAQKSALQCSAEYEAHKTDVMLRGETRKDFIDKCRKGGSGDNGGTDANN
jgi:hypothetical protein